MITVSGLGNHGMLGDAVSWEVSLHVRLVFGCGPLLLPLAEEAPFLGQVFLRTARVHILEDLRLVQAATLVRAS